MVTVQLRNVSLDYPIYDLEAARLRGNLLHRLTFGKLGELRPERRVVRALLDISLTLEAGDRLGIIGLNGAGKTTLLQMIAGVLEPTLGLRRVEGRISTLYNIGLGFDPEVSGYDNIRLRGLFMGLTPREIDAMVPGIEDFTELGEFLTLPIRTYSAGMQVRLAFAIATSVMPEILIMDEWLGAGDALFMAKSKDRMDEVVAASSMLLLASHSEALIRDNCDKAILLDRGRIVEQGDVESVYRAYGRVMARAG